MRALILIAIGLLIATCDDPATPVATLDCPVWATCAGALAIRTEIIQGAFNQSRPGRFLPGDTMLLKWTFTNRAKTRSDSIQVVYWARGAIECCRYHDIRLDAGEVLEVLDTVVTGFTHGAQSILDIINVYSIDASRFVEPVVTGVSTLPLVPSGFSIEW